MHSSSLMKAMDEGTADVFAYTYTGKPDFFFSRSVDPVLGIAESGMMTALTMGQRYYVAVEAFDEHGVSRLSRIQEM